jgi:putative ABC transport system permease protein
MWLDFRYALRALRRTPGFSLVAIASLALAIGANGAIFSLIDGLWFRPPGVANPGSLAWIFATSSTGHRGSFSFPEYRDIRDRTTSFSGVVARGRRGALLQNAGAAPELLLINVVSTNFFTVLGVRAEFGRLFTPADESNLEREPGVVLGYAFWYRRFGGDPAIVGRSIVIGQDTPVHVTVLGVLPRTFRDLDAATDRDLWMPPQTWIRQTGVNEFEQRDSRWFELVATLKPGVTTRRAGSEVGVLAQSLARTYASTSIGRGATVVSDRQYRLESGGVSALALIGVVLLVVLITCVNIANLLLARVASQVRDVAVRLALGASRTRVARQLMFESVLLGVCGAAAGVLVSLWLISALPAVLIQPPGFSSPPLFAADQRMLIFTMAVTLITTVLFGMVPSWLGSRVDLVSVIKGESALASTPRRYRSVRGVLVVSQIAVSMALLSSATVLGKSFLETRRSDLGFQRKPVLAAWSTFAQLTPAEERVAVSRLEALPGVNGVALAIRAPLSLSGGGLAQPVVFPDRPTDPTSGPPAIKYNAVSPNYFRVLGTEVVRGRAFTDEERTSPVVIVSETFAQQYFPTEDALGKVIDLKGVGHRIIGVVQNVVVNQIGEEPEPYFYLPFSDAFREMTFLIAAPRDVASLAAPVRDTLTRIDARLAPRQIVTMSDLIDFSARDYRMTAALVSALAIIGLLLTAMGIYGVVAYNATQRTKELGIRSAIGATRGQLVGLVVGDGVRLALLGLTCGLPLALFATRLLTSFLFDTAPWHVPSFLLAAFLVSVATTLASAIPAMRASTVDVIAALREN